MSDKNFKSPIPSSSFAEQAGNLVFRDEKIRKLEKKKDYPKSLGSLGGLASFSNDSDQKNNEEKKKLICEDSILTNSCFEREGLDTLIENLENNNSISSDTKLVENLENNMYTSFVSNTLMEEIPSIFNDKSLESESYKDHWHKKKSFASIEKKLNLIIEESESPILEYENSLENGKRIASIYKKLDSYDKRRLLSENPNLGNFTFQLSEKEVLEEEPLKLSLLHLELQESKAAQKITCSYVKEINKNEILFFYFLNRMKTKSFFSEHFQV